MNPFDQPVNARPQAILCAVQPGTEVVPPKLDPIAEVGTKAKPEKPLDAPPARGAAAMQRRDELEKLLVPATAAGGFVLKPDSFLGQKALTFLTGFKVGEATELGNKLSPSAAMFLAPEPIGMLPEHFFMSKPKIPGTNIYFDLLHNYTRYEDRQAANLREDVGSVQLKLVKELLPTLTTDQVRTLYLDGDLRKRNIAYVNPRVLDSLFQSELDRRGQTDAAGRALVIPGHIGNDPNADRGVVESAVFQYLGGDPFLMSELPAILANPNRVASRTSPFPTAIEDGSIQPEAIEPVNDAAKRNAASAKGIRQQLVSERADP